MVWAEIEKKEQIVRAREQVQEKRSQGAYTFFSPEQNNNIIYIFNNNY